MKLTDDQKLRVYCASFQGMISFSDKNYEEEVVQSAIVSGNKMIAALEAMPDEEQEQHQPVNDQFGH